MKKLLAILAAATVVNVAVQAAIIEQWDMGGNGQYQLSNTTGLNLGGHYNTNNHALAQTADDGTFLYSPTAGTGYGGKTALTAPIDLTAGVVTLSMAFTSINWSGTSVSNNNIGIRLYESDAGDAEYVGLQFLDSSDRIRVRMDNSAAMGGTSANFGRYGANLTASGTYNAVVEIDYANNQIRLSGAWDWNPAGPSVLTNTVNFAAAGFTTLGNFQTRYSSWMPGDTMLVDDITISQIPEPATLGMVAVFGLSIMVLRRKFMV